MLESILIALSMVAQTAAAQDIQALERQGRRTPQGKMRPLPCRPSHWREPTLCGARISDAFTQISHRGFGRIARGRPLGRPLRYARIRIRAR
jgi:hypothetical protein